MQEIIVHLEEDSKKGKAYVGKLSSTQAEMTFSKAGDKLLIIDHTEVDDSLRGQGVGRKLLNVIVEKARANGLKILPLCPYAKSVFEKDATTQDVLK